MSEVPSHITESSLVPQRLDQLLFYSTLFLLTELPFIGFNPSTDLDNVNVDGRMNALTHRHSHTHTHTHTRSLTCLLLLFSSNLMQRQMKQLVFHTFAVFLRSPRELNLRL